MKDWGDTENEDRKRMENVLVDRVNLGLIKADVKYYILDSYQDEVWDWKTSDGCTCVTEVYWPTKYFPPCVAHDRHWKISLENKSFFSAICSNHWNAVMFFKANIGFGMNPFRALVRSFGVTVSFPFAFLASWVKS